MAITEPAQFTTEKKKVAHKPIVFINFDTAGKYWASRFIDISEDTATPANWSDGTEDYEDRFTANGIGGISQSVARFGGLATLGGTEINLVNMKYATFLDDPAVNGWLEGQEVEIYLIFDDGTPLVFAESLKVFTSLVESFSIDYNTMSITLAPPEITGDIDLPANSIDGGFDAVVYGNHIWGRNELTTFSQLTLSDVNNMVKCRLVKTEVVGVNTEYTYQVSGNQLKSLFNGNAWFYDPSNGRKYNITSAFISVTNTATGGTVKLTIPVATNQITATDYIFAKGRLVGGSGITSPGNVIDQDNETYSEFIVTPAALFLATLDVGFSPIEYGSAITKPASFKVKARTTYSSAGTPVAQINSVDLAGKSTTQYNDFGTTTNVEDVVLLSYYGDPATTIDSRVYQIFKTGLLSIEFAPESFELFVECEGQADDGSGTYTGIASALLENPVHIAHHLAINYLDRATADLDASFTSPTSDAATARTSWIVDWVFSEIDSRKNVLDNIGLYILAYIWQNNEDNLKIRAIQTSSAEKFASGSTTAALSDRFSDGANSIAGSYASHWAEKMGAAVKTNIQDHANRIRANFDVNPQDGAFQQSQILTDTLSIGQYGIINKTIENTGISDKATLLLFLALYVELAAIRYYYLPISGRLDAADIEIGDVLDLVYKFDGHLLNEDGTGSGVYGQLKRKWQVLGVDRNLVSGIGRINIQVVERLQFIP